MPQKRWQRAIHLLKILEPVDSFDDLSSKGFPRSLRMHKLKWNRKNEYAIDIHETDRWRIVFKFDENAFVEVKVENYH